MGGRHAHTDTPGDRTPTRILFGMGVLLCLVVLAMVWLRPDSSPAATRDASVQQLSGVIGRIDTRPCPPPAAGSAPADGQDIPCGTAQVQLSSGRDAGKVVTAQLPTGAGAPRVAVGDAVVVAYSAGNPEQSRYAVIDQQRGTQLWIILVAFVLSLLAFGRWRGAAALVGLGVTFLVILGFVVPAILGGSPPLLVAIVGCTAIALSVLYLTHGLSRTTSVAVAGTLASLVLTGLLAVAAVGATRLSGAGDESSFVLGQGQGVDLRGLLLAGILIGSLGVLDDVTVTQAATVHELAVANPRYSARQLYSAATRVGRAHIASVINTIVLAYAGASLPLLVLIVALDDPLGQVLSDQLVATELVRSAVGTMGLIAAVPITTGVAAFAAARSRRAAEPRTTAG
jgi:uncharacterized membrane protein